MQELSSDVKERSIRMTKSRLLLLVSIRIVTNTFVLVCLVAGGAAIFYSVQVVSYVCVSSVYGYKWAWADIIFMGGCPYHTMCMYVCTYKSLFMIPFMYIFTAWLVGNPATWKHQLSLYDRHHLDQPHLPSHFWPVDQSRDVSEVAPCTLHDSAKVRRQWGDATDECFTPIPLYMQTHTLFFGWTIYVIHIVGWGGLLLLYTRWRGSESQHCEQYCPHLACQHMCAY